MSPKGYDLGDYVDVAARIAAFATKYPEGSLQSKLMREDDGWLAIAYAYRSPEDERPGIGHAFEPVPGKTPYTKDSEAMNAETSAWGRAIIALGFESKHIASSNEVKARQGDGSEFPIPESAAKKGAITKPQMNIIGALVTKLQKAELLTVEELRAHSDAQFSKTSRKELTSKEASALIDWLKEKEATRPLTADDGDAAQESAAVTAGTITKPDVPF